MGLTTMATEPQRSPAESVQEALADVWDRAYPVTIERIDSIEGAASELAREHPDTGRLDAGRSDAHKLAGVLGTFGLDRGTQLARGLEARLHPHAGPAGAREAHRMAAELRALVDCARRDPR
jgi:HPt (histidine-containing phosphotransfer) domain-containing protein